MHLTRINENMNYTAVEGVAMNSRRFNTSKHLLAQETQLLREFAMSLERFKGWEFFHDTTVSLSS